LRKGAADAGRYKKGNKNVNKKLYLQNTVFLIFYFVVYNMMVARPLISFIFDALNLKILILIIVPIVYLIGLAVPVLFLLRKLREKNIKSIYSVNGKNESVLNNKLPIFPSKSMALICRNTKAVGEKIVLLRTKIKKTGEYIAMLDEHKQDSLAADMVQRQKEYYRYFVKYYDSYCSLYLDMRFQFYLELIKTISASKKKMHKLDIKQFTGTI
jgi:hypothetical protein